MINDNDFFIVMKLVSGEQVMAILRQEDEDHVLVDHPMVMRTMVDFEAGKERITAAPLCPFTDDESFVLDKNNLLYIKKLHHVFVNHYKQIVSEYQQSTNFVPANHHEELRWEDEFTPETARKAVDQLKKVLGEEEEIDWKEKMKFLVDGNDTIN